MEKDRIFFHMDFIISNMSNNPKKNATPLQAIREKINNTFITNGSTNPPKDKNNIQLLRENWNMQ
jgi:hypothetical protein